jgi:hypothetical protein
MPLSGGGICIPVSQTTEQNGIPAGNGLFETSHMEHGRQRENGMNIFRAGWKGMYMLL